MNKATFRETVTRRVIDPDTRDRWITIAYMVSAITMLLHHVYVTAYYATVEDGAILLRFPWVFLAGVGFLLGRMWKDKCFWILLALLLMKFLRIAIPTPELVSETQRVYELCIYSFFICYAAGRVLNTKDRKTFIAVFCGLWTLAMTVYACFGLYPALGGRSIWNLGTEGFYIRPSEQRLWPVFHPVDAGMMTASGIAAALIGFFMTKRKTVKILYTIAMILICLMGIFCVSRISYLLTAMAVSAPVSMAMYELLLKWKRQGKAFSALRIAAAFAAFAAAAVLLVVVQMKAVPVLNSLRTGVISDAAAEETLPEETVPRETVPEGTAAPETEESGIFSGWLTPKPEEILPAETETPTQMPVEVTARDFVTDEGADGLLTGRLVIWLHVYDSFELFPEYMLIGQGVYDPMNHINTSIRAGNALPEIYHLHSTFIQTLWESGFPGFLLFTAFFLIFAWNAFLLIRDRSLPLWQRILPIPAVLCWLADMADCTGYCNWGKPPMTILYLFTGLTIAIARENRKNNKGAKQA